MVVASGAYLAHEIAQFGAAAVFSHALNCSVALFLGSALIATLTSLLRSREVSQTRIEVSEREVTFLAENDPLTGIFNRRGFEERANALLEGCTARNTGAILIQLDADRFKDVNDVHGHAAGDLVLVEIAGMLRREMPEDAVIGRLGGDEFAVFVSADSMGERAVAADLGLPSEVTISLDDVRRRLTVKTSAGFARFPEDGAGLNDLLKAADLALLAVKRSGKGRIAPYNVHMTTSLHRRVWEIDSIQDALSEGTLVPYYQPLVCARTGRIEGLEALARWKHPVLGVLTPDRFGSALQDRSVGPKITTAMMDAVIADLVELRARGLPHVSIGLNIGEADLQERDLPRILAEKLRAAGLPLKSVAIEVTEHCLNSENRQDLGPVLAAFRANGAFLALDDFGTGTSSITLLKEIDYTAIKIDRSFIKDVCQNPADLAITRALVQLGRDLGFKIVAEGIETREQLTLLRDLGVDLLQGYLFSRPVPFEKTVHMLEVRNSAGKSRPKSQAHTARKARPRETQVAV